MKRQLNLLFFLTAALFFCLTAAAPAQAAEPVPAVEETYVNPLYRDVLSEDDLKKPQDSQEPENSTAAKPDYASTIADAAAVLREGMKNREGTVTVYYQTNSYADTLAEEISEAATAHTGKPTEGDYLLYQYGGWASSTSGYNNGSRYCLTLTYTITYYTTTAQETKMDTAVSTLLSDINVSGGSDYQKVKAIYDYICGNVTYDNANLNDGTYTLKYTAYAALVNQTAVCQGYAVLFYRLALELGVDARVITGTGNGGPHAWNIVEIDGSYYNLDATWDANYQTGYQYFLKCSANFSNHTRSTNYSSDTFNASYPMAAGDYAASSSSVNHSHAYKDNVISEATCTETGLKTCTCSCGDSYTAVIPAAGHKYDDGVVTRAATCGAAGVRTYTCSVCEASRTEEIPATGKHSYDDGEVTKEATTSQTGTRLYTCQVCGETLLETIPKLSPAAPTLTFKSSSVTKAMGNKAFTNTLTRITDGELTYTSSNTKVAKVNASTGKVTLKGVGTTKITVTADAGADYAAGSASYTLKVNPSKTTLSSVKNVRTKKMTVKWKKNSTGSGYKIQYSTSSKFTKKTTKTVTVKKNSTVSKTISKLKKSKKYYVRIRAYKTVSGKTYYGAWSNKKSVKIKK